MRKYKEAVAHKNSVEQFLNMCAYCRTYTNYYLLTVKQRREKFIELYDGIVRLTVKN